MCPAADRWRVWYEVVGSHRSTVEGKRKAKSPVQEPVKKGPFLRELSLKDRSRRPSKLPTTVRVQHNSTHRSTEQVNGTPPHRCTSRQTLHPPSAGPWHHTDGFVTIPTWPTLHAPLLTLENSAIEPLRPTTPAHAQPTSPRPPYSYVLIFSVAVVQTEHPSAYGPHPSPTSSASNHKGAS